MLEVKNLRVHFKTAAPDRFAVDGTSFTVGDGEIVGLVGESGSGKSVTAMAISGLLPRRQSEYSGEIWLDGVEILNGDRNLMRQMQGDTIGVIFQEPMSAFDPIMPIGRQVEESLLVHHPEMSPAARRSAALTAMAEAELDEPETVYEKYPHELSGGMLQRAMIAAAIVIEPELLLLDEPTTALDVTIQAQVMELLQKIVDEKGTSLIVVTHNLGLVTRHAERIYVMYAGKIIESGTTEEIITKPQHPYTMGLLKSVPKLDEKDDAQLIPIDGAPPSLINLPNTCAFMPRCPYACEKCKNSPYPAYRQVPGHEHYVACHLDLSEVER